MTRRLLTVATALVGVALTTAEAQAISRYSSTAMSCNAIHAAIANEGAVLLRWTQPPNIQRYERFVANDSFCYGTQIGVPYSVPSANGACTVYRCEACRPDDYRNGFNFGGGC